MGMKNKQQKMKNILNIILVLMSTAKGHQMEDIHDIVKGMVAVEMRETHAKVHTLEKEIKTRDNIINTLDMDMKNMKTKHDLLEKKMTVKDDSLQKLSRNVAFLKDPPYTFFCSSSLEWLHITTATITYSKLLYSSTSTWDTPATMDIETGIFTSGWSGTYTVTWSVTARDGAGDDPVTIFLRKNGEMIDESIYKSYYTGPSGFIRDQGSRTLLVHLDIYDTLDLFCDDCNAGVEYVTFCVTMSSFDYE